MRKQRTRYSIGHHPPAASALAQILFSSPATSDSRSRKRCRTSGSVSLSRCWSTAWTAGRRPITVAPAVTRLLTLRSMSSPATEAATITARARCQREFRIAVCIVQHSIYRCWQVQLQASAFVKCWLEAGCWKRWQAPNASTLANRPNFLLAPGATHIAICTFARSPRQDSKGTVHLPCSARRSPRTSTPIFGHPHFLTAVPYSF